MLASQHLGLIRRFIDREQRAGLLARHERTVGVVAAIGESLPDHRRSGRPRCARHLRRVGDHDGQRAINLTHGVDDHAGQVPIMMSVVVERTMRLDMSQHDSLTIGDLPQRGDLLGQRRAKRRRRHGHRLAPEVRAIGV